MRRPLVVAALIAVIAVVVGGGGWKMWTFGNEGGFWASMSQRLKRHQTSGIPHCSLLETKRRGDFVIAAERVVLPDGVYPAASESRTSFVRFFCYSKKTFPLSCLMMLASSFFPSTSTSSTNK